MSWQYFNQNHFQTNSLLGKCITLKKFYVPLESLKVFLVYNTPFGGKMLSH